MLQADQRSSEMASLHEEFHKLQRQYQTMLTVGQQELQLLYFLL